MSISHASSQKIEFFTVRFDSKEFRVKVTDCQRHHKDYPEITDVVVTQVPSMDDSSKAQEMVFKELDKEEK